VDSDQAKDKKPKGPGEGFPWKNVNFEYSLEWENGLSNDDSQGNVVYIPQNFLYEMSGKPEEIKNKILPVLSKKLPQIGMKYTKAERDIKGINDEFRKATEKWFEEKYIIEDINDALKDLGTKKAVQAEKKKTDNQIKVIKEKYKVKAIDLRRYQNLNELISAYEQRISQIEDDLEQIGEEGKIGEYFRNAEISLIPQVTDYFSIDNYKKVRQFVNDIRKIDDFTEEEKSQIRKILLIPNVELRMLPATDSGKMINIHYLFNPDFVDSLDNDFFGSIEYSGGDRSYKMNRKDIIALGKSSDPKLNDEKAYLKGISEFAVSHESLQKLKETNKDFRNNVLIAVCNSSHDGASGLQKHFDLFEGKTVSSPDGVRKAIYKISDCIFSGNPEDAEYFTGKKKDKADTVVLKCGTLKPCIHGSDAHTESKLFNPDQDRYCWIKADPTFNGLQQILHEPFPGD